MTTAPIDESGMMFGPYPAGECFHIEKSQCYRLIQEGVKMAEFLLMRQKTGQPPVVWIVEAKSSSPNPETQPNFDQFIDDVCSKLNNAFLLGIAARLQRHSAAGDELPPSFQALDLQQAGFRFVLIINGHKEEWLPPVQDALMQALKPEVKTWALSPLSVAVMNHEGAQSWGLILPTAPRPQ